MTAFLSAFFLVAGAAICLIAALGVLRLPDFFMRMHAATKAGVAGCGLLLTGVAFAEPSVAMWIRVAVAIAFLLLTTPIAGHLLARAGYVAGVPLWGGTVQDALDGELRRGNFERPRAASRATAATVERVVLALASGPGTAAAIAHALALAEEHGAELVALGIVDTKMLRNVGPVPLGANHHAERLRNSRIARARGRMSATVQSFEQAAVRAGVRFRVGVEEGDPLPVLRAWLAEGDVLVLPRGGWFDHGIAGRRVDPASWLARHRIGKVEPARPADGPIMVSR